MRYLELCQISQHVSISTADGSGRGPGVLSNPSLDPNLYNNTYYVRSTAGTLRLCAKHIYIYRHDSDAQYFISWFDHRKMSNKLEANCICSVSKNKSTPQIWRTDVILCVQWLIWTIQFPHSFLIRSDIILNVAGHSSSVSSVSAWHAGCPRLIPTSGTFLHGDLIMKTFVRILPLLLIQEEHCHLLEKY